MGGRGEEIKAWRYEVRWAGACKVGEGLVWLSFQMLEQNQSEITEVNALSFYFTSAITFYSLGLSGGDIDRASLVAPHGKKTCLCKSPGSILG